VFDVAVSYLALGLDAAKAVLPPVRRAEVAELTWILSTVTGMGPGAGAFVQGQDRAGIARASAIHLPGADGADILIYRSHVVRSARTRCNI